jgi:RNA polymerase sigma factor (sigma-70 family)
MAAMSPGLPTRLLATQSDERLIALARDGHERAFEALVLRYRRPLLRYCRRLPLADGRVEDVLQQSLLQAWMALERGVHVREPRAWLYRIVHNTAVNTMREARVTPDVAGHLGGGADALRGADTPQLEAASEPDLEGGLVVREALAEMAALPPMQREVMVRTAMGGHSHEEVASALGISDGAVRGLLYRARATLRTAVTAITPPPLLVWLAGGAAQSGQPSEGLAELAAGGGTAGLGGLLVKGGVVAVTAGTLITTSVGVLHIRVSARHGGQHPSASVGTAGRSNHAGGASGGQAVGTGGQAAGGAGTTGVSATRRATHRSRRAGGGKKAPLATRRARHGGDSHALRGFPAPPAHMRGGGGRRAIPDGSPPPASSPPPGPAPATSTSPSGSSSGPDSSGDQPVAQRQTPSGGGSTSSGDSGSSGSPSSAGGSSGASGGGGDGHETGAGSGDGCLSAGVGPLGVRVCLGDRAMVGEPRGSVGQGGGGEGGGRAMARKPRGSVGQGGGGQGGGRAMARKPRGPVDQGGGGEGGGDPANAGRPRGSDGRGGDRAGGHVAAGQPQGSDGAAAPSSISTSPLCHPWFAVQCNRNKDGATSGSRRMANGHRR